MCPNLNQTLPSVNYVQIEFEIPCFRLNSLSCATIMGVRRILRTLWWWWAVCLGLGEALWWAPGAAGHCSLAGLRARALRAPVPTF